MSVADILMIVIMSGIGLSVVYLVAEFSRWRKQEAAERSKAADFRVLQDRRVSRPERAVFESRVVAGEAGAIPEAASADDITNENGIRRGSRTKAA
ncbi:MAG: hypothetical protein JWM63_4169 [Gammaproteobacteria bacterium]|jgi:hypothetical protein|nr:hypothetical protein [Gammaproteobacteria bacterium]